MSAKFLFFLSLGFVCMSGSYGCLPSLGVAEQYEDFPENKWHNKEHITPNFMLSDTTQVYKIFFVVRHWHHYAYKNLWIDFKLIPPAADDSTHYKLSLPLADDNYGWLASGMGNLYETRVFWQTLRPKQAGKYRFEISHLMEDASIKGLRSIGIRIEQ